MRCHLALACAALLALLPSSHAVLCENFGQDRCNTMWTSSGKCGWDAAAGKCLPTGEQLPPGRVGITSVQEPMIEGPSSTQQPRTGRPALRVPVDLAPQGAPAPAPAPERRGFGRRLMQNTAGPCVDKPTPEGFTCAQQRRWGKCSELWMIQGGFCRFTCGMCGPAASAAAGMAPPANATTAAPAVEAGATKAPTGDIIETLPAGSPRPQPPAAANASFCTQPRQTGPCRAAIPRWYYNADSSKCMPFMYGGCQGNANNFETFAECEAAAAQFCAPNVTAFWDP